MVAFKGRSNDTVKLKGKPINTGYIWSWLFHSRAEGVETFIKSEQTEWPRAGHSTEKIFYFLIDVACVNAYLLWKWSCEANSEYAERTHNGHRGFMKALCDQLLHSNDPIEEKQPEKQPDQSHSTPTTVLSRHHKQVHQKSHGRCEWGELHPPGCPRKRSTKKRKFGTDITATVNGTNEAILGGSRTHFECSKCQVWLCIQGSCWQQYHHSIGVNC
jgi:hypothetical protein